jgi:hypothetical protein
MVMAGSGCVICGEADDDTHRHMLGRLDNGPSTVLQACPADMGSPRIRRMAGVEQPRKREEDQPPEYAASAKRKANARHEHK